MKLTRQQSRQGRGTEILSASVSAEMKKRIEGLAAEWDISVSRVVREAFERYLREVDAGKHPLLAEGGER